MIRHFRSLALPVFAGVLVGFVMPQGCAKKRSPRYAQGQGEYLYNLNDFRGKSFELKTGDVMAPGVASDADEIILRDGNKVMRSFNAVAFEADIGLAKFSSDSLADYSFFGKPNFNYKLELGFTENHLVVYKVAKIQDVPSDEMTYSIKVAGSDDMVKVPLLGYPISKYAVEYIEDSRGKSTKTKTTISKDFLAESTHFKVDTSAVVYFDKEEKINLLPSSFFDQDHEWFYEITIVDGPLDTFLGQQLGAGKARFTKTSNSLMAVDVNIPEEAQSLSGEKLPRILQLPVRWAEFRLVDAGDSAQLEEKLLDEKDAGAHDWQERPFGLLDFRRINNLDSANANSIRLKRLEIDDDYISFIIASSSNGIALHFSFARDDSKIAGYTYPSLDRKKFGFWRHLKVFYPGQLTASEQSFDENVSLGRMYPKDNVIEVFLTENTPDNKEFISAIQDAVDAWDAAFSEAARGSDQEANPIKVKLNLDKRVQNGDVRYNKISFYDFNINVGSLLGYGPSVSDDRNGQIFSSTNHIYLRTYREGVYSNLKSYVRHRMGLYNNKQVQGIDFPDQILRSTGNANLIFEGVTPDNSAYARELGLTAKQAGAVHTGSNLFMTPRDRIELYKSVRHADDQDMYREFINKFRPETTSDDQATPEASKAKNYGSEFGNFSHNCQYQAALANTFDEIERICGELKFGSYVESMVASAADVELELLKFPKDVFDECALKLLEPTLRSTLVHEFGHNLGLTHNFKGSADDANFDRDANGLPVSRSTSVMDYPQRDEDRATVPGPYDVAALRYGYYRTVETKETDSEGKHAVVSIATENPRDTRPIEARVSNPADLRSYKYCWDFDIDLGPFEGQIPNDDPDCRRWDRGSNPVQMAYSFIDQFNTITSTGRHRFENINLGDPDYYLFQQVMTPLRTLYVKYRYMLYLKTRNQNDPYFVKNEEDFDQFIKTYVGDVSIDNLPKDSIALEKYVESLPEIQQYKLASDVIFKFFMQVAFGPDQYCVVWDKTADGKKFAYASPFMKVRSQIFNDTRANGGVTVNSCSDAAPYLAKDNQDVSEAGNVFRNVPYTADDAVYQLPFTRTYDSLHYLEKDDLVHGMIFSRLVAFEMMTSRLGTPLFVAHQNGFFPSMLDNPKYRKELVSAVESRLVEGVSLSTLGVKPENLVASSKGFTAQYSEEQDMMGFWHQLLSMFMMPPGENVPERLRELVPDVYNRADFARIFPDPEEAGIVYVRDARGNYYVSEDANSFIYRLISSFSDAGTKINNTVLLSEVKKKKSDVLKSMMDVQTRFFTALNQTPDVDLNAVKLALVDHATYLLVVYYNQLEADPLPPTPDATAVTADNGDDTPVVDGDTGSTDGMDADGTDTADTGSADTGADTDGGSEPTEPTITGPEAAVQLAEKAKPYLDYAKDAGVPITQKFIRSLVFELAGAKELEQDFSEMFFDALATDDDFKYNRLALAVISFKLRTNNTDVSADDAAIIEDVYKSSVADMEKVKLTPNEFSEYSAKENILRGMILQ